MTYAAIIIDNRPEIACKSMELHKPFIPEWWEIKAFTEYEINSPADYNRLLTSPDFWAQLDYDRVLIFQHDSRLLKAGVEEFCEWDYIGAPWKFQQHGGNGGLSIRNPRVMQDICQGYKYDHSCNEDVWFCNIMESSGMNLAPRSECEKFAVESIFKLNTIGAHAIEKHLTKEQVNQIYAQ